MCIISLFSFIVVVFMGITHITKMKPYINLENI